MAGESDSCLVAQWSWLEFTSSSQCPWPVVTFWPHRTVVGLIGYWLYILPAGSPGSYSLSHTGDAYLSLHSLNGEGLSIAPSLQPQVCTEDSCKVDLNAVDPATQNPWIPTLSIAPFDLDLSCRPCLDFTFDPPPINSYPNINTQINVQNLQSWHVHIQFSKSLGSEGLDQRKGTMVSKRNTPVGPVMYFECCYLEIMCWDNKAGFLMIRS